MYLKIGSFLINLDNVLYFDSLGCRIKVVFVDGTEAIVYEANTIEGTVTAFDIISEYMSKRLATTGGVTEVDVLKIDKEVKRTERSV